MKAARERALGVREQAKRRTLSVKEHVKLDENHSLGIKPGADYDPND